MAYINRIAWVTIDTTGTVNNFNPVEVLKLFLCCQL